MQSWTPLRHIRSIGAWPARAHRRGADLNLHLNHHPRSAHEPRAPSQRAVHSSTRPSSVRHPNDPSRSWGSVRDIAPKDLPLPPFLRSNDRNNTRAAAKQGRRSSRLPDDIYSVEQDPKYRRKRSENLKRAPFSTALAENPYAHALATPVREDRFTDARLPSSCLVDLYPVDLSGDNEVEEPPDVEPATSTKAKARARAQGKKAYMLPLSMAAELTNKKKKVMTPEEQMARDAVESDQKMAPSGSASYIILRKEALDHVSEQPDKRPKGLAVSRRVLMNMGSLRIGWRTDMGDFVLDAMRRVLIKKMRFFLTMKTTVDKPGAFVGMPGNAGLERLDDVDDVMCVLRLKTEGKLEEVKGSEALQEDSSNDDDSDHIWAGIESDIDDELLESEEEEEDKPQSESELDAMSPSSSNVEGQDQEEITSGSDTTDTSIPFPSSLNRAAKNRLRDGHWKERQPRTEPHLIGLRVPAPPAERATIYFPTLPYRNRRVAAYHLPSLLGEEYTTKLLKDTVFRDSEHMAVTSTVMTVGVQVWLLKLAAYIGKGKDQTPWV